MSASFFKKIVPVKVKKDGEDNQRQPVDSRRSEIPEEPPVPHDFDALSHGLFVLHPTAEVYVEPEAIEVDIVAIHGLNGSVRNTWTDPATGNFWLEDQLPDAIPASRIMTFGYDSGLAFSRSRSGIDNFSRDLLNRLRVARNTHEVKFSQPLLGGIVVKKVRNTAKPSAQHPTPESLPADQRPFVAQALVMAHEDADRFGAILRSTVGIVFLGTPHRGSEMVKWTALLTNVINVASFGQGIRKTLLENLDVDSAVLTEISRQFVPRAKPPMMIMSFIEQQIERPLTTLVVPERSAILGLHNERVIPLNAHHRNICRFRGARDQNYILVEAAIKELAFGGGQGVQELNHELRHTDSRSTDGFMKDTPGLLKRAGRDPDEILPGVLNAPAAVGDSNIIHRNAEFICAVDHPAATCALATSNSMYSNPAPATIPVAGTPSTSSSASAIQTPYTSLNSLSRKLDGPVIRQVPSEASVQEPAEMLNIRIDGLLTTLTLENYGSEPQSCTLQLPGDTRFRELQSKLEEAVPGLREMVGFNFPGHEGIIDHIWKDVFTTPIEVTSGRPCYDASRGLMINLSQPVAAFLSKAFPTPIEAALYRDSTPSAATVADDSPFAQVSSSRIAVGRPGRKNRSTDLKITFQRTIRVPETQRRYDLPPGLGGFPIFDIRPFSASLPASVVDKGGLFFPMYRTSFYLITRLTPPLRPRDGAQSLSAVPPGPRVLFR
ncbi:hypothetical protein MAPG_10493 [Magnaporthiopsis poae ATCC 64411]|uniref:Uncharacterized protein n=1 Tax=Magnaporthiopsis poae (strain ATCC 64411 / 73-15) TaxID=644358 RepID=A0A0C4ECR0_MAGP6|nr:hypothetical protein MAPG_10493 [Magnaporthiopsis poae ATCC 64411]